MKTNPLMIFAGLAIAALAVLLGLTRDRWYGSDPEVTAAPMAALEEKTEPPKIETPPVQAEADEVAAPKAGEPEMPAEVKSETPKAVETTAKAVTPPEPEAPAVQAEAPKAEPPKVEKPAEIAAPPKPEEPAAQTAVTKTEPPKVEESAEVAVPPKPEEPVTQTAVNKSEPPKIEEKTAVEILPPPEEPVAVLPKADPPKIEDRVEVVEELPPVEEPPQQQAATDKTALPQPEPEAAAVPAETDAPGFDTVRVEKTGEAVIAGRAEAGSEVTVKHNGKAIGTAVANADGAFVVVPDAPLPPGNGALTLEAKSTGDSIARKASETVAVAVPEKEDGSAMVAVVSPDQPTKVLQKPEAKPVPEKVEPQQVQSAAVEPAAEQPVAETPSKSAPPVTTARSNISLDAVDYDAQGNIVFSGRGNSGSAIRLYVDNQAVGESRSDAEGRWSFSGPARIAPGTHRLRVDELAEGGGVASRVELPFFREEAAKVALAAPESEVPAVAEDPAELTAPAPSPETQAALTEAPVIEAPQDGRIVIQPGNNLWKLSRVIYGKGMKYTVIYEANKDHIRDPDLIYPGQVFKTPDAVPPESIDPVRREPLTPEEGGATAQ